MYQDHFQLKTQPFCEHASATSLWVDSRMQEGLARLNYLAESATLGLVTGPTGSGKSTLLKRFLHEVSRQRCEPVYCHLTRLNSSGLLRSLISQLGEVPKRGKERLFEQILQRATRSEGTLLLIIDEAHLLDGEALTDLRLLVSSAMDVAPPLKILLVGQEALRSTLKRSQHGDLLNRIGRALPTEAADQGANGPLHRRPDEAGRRCRGHLRSVGEGVDSRFHGWRSSGDQQLGDGLLVAGGRSGRAADRRSAVSENLDRVPAGIVA